MLTTVNLFIFCLILTPPPFLVQMKIFEIFCPHYIFFLFSVLLYMLVCGCGLTIPVVVSVFSQDDVDPKQTNIPENKNPEYANKVEILTRNFQTMCKGFNFFFFLPHPLPPKKITNAPI